MVLVVDCPYHTDVAGQRSSKAMTRGEGARALSSLLIEAERFSNMTAAMDTVEVKPKTVALAGVVPVSVGRQERRWVAWVMLGSFPSTRRGMFESEEAEEEEKGQDWKRT